MLNFLKVFIGIYFLVCLPIMAMEEEEELLAKSSSIVRASDPRQDLRLHPYPTNGDNLFEISTDDKVSMYLLGTFHSAPLQFALPPSTLYPILERCNVAFSEVGSVALSSSFYERVNDELDIFPDTDEFRRQFFLTPETLQRHQAMISSWYCGFLKSIKGVGEENLKDKISGAERRKREVRKAFIKLFPDVEDLVQWYEACKLTKEKIDFMGDSPLHPLAYYAASGVCSCPAELAELWERGMDSRLDGLCGDYSIPIWALEREEDRLSPVFFQELADEIQKANLHDICWAIRRIRQRLQEEEDATFAHELQSQLNLALRNYVQFPPEATADATILSRNGQWMRILGRVLLERRSAPVFVFVGRAHVVDLIERFQSTFGLSVSIKQNPVIQ